MELEKFSPEVLYSKPFLVDKLDSFNNFYVTQCLFIAKHHIFVICLNEKSKKNSKLEIYNFRSIDVVKDSFVIESNKSKEVDLPFDRSYSFGCLGRSPHLSSNNMLKEEME